LRLKEVEVHIPQSKEHGDFSTNIAMALSSKTNMSPIKLGNEIKNKILSKYDFFKEIKIEGPGFINFYLEEEYLYNTILETVESGEFKEFEQSNKKTIKICVVLDKLSSIIGLENFRAFMNMYYLGNIYSFTGYDVEKLIVVNYIDKDMYTSYFLSNFKNIEITDDYNRLEGSIVFCSPENQWLFHDNLEAERFVVERVKVYKNKHEIKNMTLNSLMEKIGLNRLKYTFCTRSLNSEVELEITRDDLKYVQYPYSRISSLMNILKKEGINIKNVEDYNKAFSYNDLEKELIKKLPEFKDALVASMELGQPYRLIRYGDELCEVFYKVNNSTLFRQLHTEKLVILLKALNCVKTVIKEVLMLLEVPMYEKM
jgi:arginyl-tRNA synthetase